MDKTIMCKEIHTFLGNTMEVLLPSAHECYCSKKEFKKKKNTSIARKQNLQNNFENKYNYFQYIEIISIK